MQHSRRQALKTIVGAGAFPSATISPTAFAAESRPSGALPIRLLVLDLGGTTIQDRGDVPEALRRAFANHGITVTSAEIGAWRGASKRQVVRHFAQQRTAEPNVDRGKLADAIYKDFNARVKKAYSTAEPIAGAEETFVELRKGGFLLATTTGFDREIATSIFDRLKWHRYFIATVTSDDVTQGRPAPFLIFHAMESARVNNVSEVVAVGDTPLDLQAGSNAGVRGVVGVTSGAFTSEQLGQERHTHLLPSIAGLPALLRSNF